MKKIIYFLLLIAISGIYSACNSSASADEPIGKYTFELLQKLDTISSDDFVKYFVSLEELREFAKDTSIQGNFRNAITTVSEEIHQKRILQAYEMLKESGKNQQINWADITYEAYTFQLRIDSGVTFQDGYLVFSHDSKKYIAKLVSFNYKEEQRLFILSNIEPALKY